MPEPKDLFRFNNNFALVFLGENYFIDSLVKAAKGKYKTEFKIRSFREKRTDQLFRNRGINVLRKNN